MCKRLSHILLFLFVLGFLLQCNNKEKDYHIKESSNYFYDSVQSKRVNIYDYESFKELTMPKNDSTYVFGFFATYHSNSLAELNAVDSFLQNKKLKAQLVYTSLDFYSGAKQKLLEFNHSKQSKLILLHEPKVFKWYKKIDTDWHGMPTAWLVCNKDSASFYFHTKKETIINLLDAL